MDIKTVIQMGFQYIMIAIRQIFNLKVSLYKKLILYKN